MNAFLKTLFGDLATMTVVAVVMAVEVVLVACGWAALSALVVPFLVLAGIAWIATT